MSVQLREARPRPEDFARLRDACGWGLISHHTAQRALAASLVSVVAEDAGTLVGMGRAIGDGHIYAYLQDVIVVPSHRHLGLGDKIVQALMQRLEERLPKGAMVGLMAAEGVERLYERHGFVARPRSGMGAGMVRFLGQDEQNV